MTGGTFLIISMVEGTFLIITEYGLLFGTSCYPMQLLNFKTKCNFNLFQVNNEDVLTSTHTQVVELIKCEYHCLSIFSCTMFYVNARFILNFLGKCNLLKNFTSTDGSKI